MNNCLITVIVPIYNTEKYLSKCLNSIVNQKYSNLEIILVNDGSTDNSTEIINDFSAKDNRIIVINKENGGIGSALKLAIKRMTGDYVLFVDSDDWLELDAVESLVKLAQENYADIVSFGLRAFNPQGEEVALASFKNIDLINITNEAVLKTHFEVLKHPTLVRLYKHELFKDIVVFEQNIGIDEMLTPQLLAKCNRAVYTSKVFYNVLIRQDSVCRAMYTKEKINQTHSVYNFLIDYTLKNVRQYHFIFIHKYIQVLNGMLMGYVQGNIAVQENELTDLIERTREILKLYINNKEKLKLNALILYRIALITKFPRLSIYFIRYYTRFWKLLK